MSRKFYSTSSSESSSSSLSSESSGEDMQMAVIRRLNGTACHDREYDEEREEREDLKSRTTDLNCGSCPRGRAKKKGMMTSAKAFEGLVLPETEPINSTTTTTTTDLNCDNTWRMREKKKKGTTALPMVKSFESLVLPETVPITSASLKLNNERKRSPYDYDAPTYDEDRLRKYVQENFPAKPVQTTAQRLLQHQAKIDTLAKRLEQTSLKSSAVSPLPDFPEVDLDAKHKKHHHHNNKRRSDATGWGKDMPVEEMDAAAVTVGDYKARPITVSFPNTQLSALKTKLATADKPGNESLRSVLLQGNVPNFAAPTTLDCQWEQKKMTIFRHLAKSHTQFYQLLRDNNLLEMLEKTQDLTIFIPDEDTLSDITNRVSEETKGVLLYHCIIVPVDQPIRLLTGMTEYESLHAGKVVQVEKKNDAFYANGHVLKSDVVFHKGQLFHIMGLLSPKELVFDTPPEDLPPPLNPDETEAEAEPEPDADTESTTDTTTTTQEEPAGTAQMMAVNAAALTLKGFNAKTSVTLNSAIGQIASNMSKYVYSTPIDAKSYLDATFVANAPIAVAFRAYNTDRLFESYQQKRMADIMRVEGVSVGNPLVVSATQQRRLDIGNNQSLTEFQVDQTQATIKKADLLAGVTELSLTVPNCEGKMCVLKCLIQGHEVDFNTFVSHDESLLMRFKNNVLDTVAINMDKATANMTDAHTDPHFLELFTTADQRQKLYADALSKESFNMMLLGESSIQRYLKKKARQAKRKIGKWTRYTLSKGEREAKKRMAHKVKPIGKSKLPVKALEDFESTATPMNAFVTVIVYDKSLNIVQEQSIEGVNAQKYLYAIDEEKFAGYVFPAEYGLAKGLGVGQTGQYLQVKTQFESVWFNFSAVTMSVVDAYWAVQNATLFVLVFDVSGNLVRMVNMLKRTKLIQGVAL